MAAVTFKLEGLRELESALNEFKASTARNVARRALKKAAEPMVRDASERAPVDTGWLEESIHAGTRLSRRQRAAEPYDPNWVTLSVGPGASARSIVQEFGSFDQHPQPYMRPAWDGNARGMLGSIQITLTEEIMKSAVRAARKALKAL